jgi:PAS domain S-box-containing protein
MMGRERPPDSTLREASRNQFRTVPESATITGAEIVDMLRLLKNLFRKPASGPSSTGTGTHRALQVAIVERDEAAKGKRQAEESLHQIVAGVVDYAIFMLDTEGCVRSWNAGAQRIKGYRRDEILGNHISIFYPEEAKRRHWPEHELQMARQTGRFEDEGWRLRKDGSRFWANVIITALRDDEGQLRGFSKVTRDLTDQKRNEDAIRLAHAELEDRVLKRTAELAEANHHLQIEVEERKRLEHELKRRLEQLAEADRHKNEFLAMLAHELRNPLAPLRNALHILKMPSVDTPTVQRAREMMERQLGNLVRLVDDLLDISRIIRGNVDLHRENVDLATVVRRAIETAQPMIDAQGHELFVSLPPDKVILHVDVIRLAQVISNLLVNAAKYTEQSGQIRLSGDCQAGQAIIRVRDNGIGIAPELLPRVFDLFVQADRALARSQGGLGIGLTLVKRLVESHGGTVDVHSDGPGRGSEFTVRLPAVADSPVTPAGDAQPAGVPGGGRPRRVLIVDDNVDAADSAALLLRMWGHQVHTVHDGLSVSQAVRDFRPEIILLDIGLPGMTGYEVAQHLRAQPALDSLVLAAMTGYGQDEDRKRSAEAGFNYHLTKPLDPSKLEALIEKTMTEPTSN